MDGIKVTVTWIMPMERHASDLFSIQGWTFASMYKSRATFVPYFFYIALLYCLGSPDIKNDE